VGSQSPQKAVSTTKLEQRKQILALKQQQGAVMLRCGDAAGGEIAVWRVALRARNLDDLNKSPLSYGFVMMRSCISPHSR
jgi:hypothetical protein